MNWQGLFVSLFVVVGFVGSSATFDRPRAQEGTGARPEISGDPERPRRHFRTRDAAVLTKEQSRSVYAGIRRLLDSGYSGTGNPIAEQYGSWNRYNDAPFRSATHGQRYVNNYANAIAAPYGKYEKAGKLPVGSIIAKDSFAVTQIGEVKPGPLFVMEKMPAGFNYVSGDWRYTMITPEGELFGMTKGENAERVEYCIGCHLVRESHDHLFFVPEVYRNDP